MKKLSLLFIAVVVALTLSACKKTTTGSGEESANSQNYFGSYAGHYETLNYLYTQSASDSDLYSNFVDGLVENDNYGNIVPSLATGWDYEMRDGKQVWTFDIRQGVKWVESDGTEYAEVEAQDWISAAEYILNPSTQSDLTFLMFVFIDGAEAYYTAKEDIANAKADIKAADLILNDTTKTAEEKAAAQVTKTSAQEVLDETVEKPFSSVGVKAVEKYKLEYTLAKPAPYFLTALTYSVFFPVNKAWLQDQGTNFGYDGESILYNGAYTLTEDQVDAKVEFTKNAKYWDAKNVNINKVTLVFIPADAGYDWARLKYENKELTGFRLNPSDTTGWGDYVSGPNNTGTKDNPYNPEAYLTQATSKFTYYMLWNFNRTAFDGSEKTADEKTATNKAILNTEFRLGFLHGMDTSKFLVYYTADNPTQYARNVYTPRDLATDQEQKDYVDYFAEEYAENKGLTFEDAKTKLADGVDIKFDKAKALVHFQTAKQELIASGDLEESDFPIIVETVAGTNPNQLPYYKSLINAFNAEFGDYVTFTLNIPDNRDEWTLWSNTKLSYDLRWQMGWGPDYADPLTYLNTYVVNGDMQYYSGLDESNVALQNQLFGEYTALVRAADQIYELDQMDDRFAKFAEAEYKLVYEEALIIPYLATTGTDVYVSRTKPYTAMKANYGLSGAKFKYMIILADPLTRDERNGLKAEYDANK